MRCLRRVADVLRRRPLTIVVNIEAVLQQTDDRSPRKRAVLRRLNLFRNGYDLDLLTDGIKPDFTTEPPVVYTECFLHRDRNTFLPSINMKTHTRTL